MDTYFPQRLSNGKQGNAENNQQVFFALFMQRHVEIVVLPGKGAGGYTCCQYFVYVVKEITGVNPIGRRAIWQYF